MAEAVVILEKVIPKVGPFAGAELAEWTDIEDEIFKRQYAKFIYEEVSPSVRKLLIENEELVRDLVRRVKTETKTVFRGAYARGRELVLIKVRPQTWAKTTWLVSVTAGAAWYLGTETAPRTLAEQEGEIILGWADPIDKPKINAVQLWKAGIGYYAPESIAFDLVEKYPLHSLKEPWIVQPEQSYAIRVYYFATGDDNFQPVAFYVTIAEKLAKAL